MNVDEFLLEIEEETKTILALDFNVLVTETDIVPEIGDSNITFPNLDKQEIKCKTLETCVLFIDIRKSTEMNLIHDAKTLSKLYSAFIRSMMKSAEFYGGKIRNIVGDRVMIVYDRKDCFINAVRTSILLNTICEKYINKYFVENVFTCGIGIDYGKMIITKAGIVKHGVENSSYKSFVWLGRTANIASKLTDMANKDVERLREFFERDGKIVNELTSQSDFVSKLKMNLNVKEEIKGKYEQFFKVLENEVEFNKMTKNCLYHTNEEFRGFLKTQLKSPPILITKEVLDGLKNENSLYYNLNSFWWGKLELNSHEFPYNTIVFGSKQNIDCETTLESLFGE